MTNVKWADKARKLRQRGQGTPSGACVEGLEGRRLLATATFASTAYNASWDDPASWQGNHVPAEGDDIVFPDLGTGDAFMLVLAYQHHVVGNLTFAGPNWNIDTTPGLTLTGDIFVTGTQAQLVNVNLTRDLTVNVAPESTLLIGSYTRGNGHDLTIAGGGAAQLYYLTDVPNVAVEQGEATLYSNQFPAARVDAGATLTGSSRVGSLVGNGGTIRPGTAAVPARLTSRNGISLPAGNTLEIGMGAEDWMGFGDGKGQLTASGGPVDITGSTLAVKQVAGFVPAIGAGFTILDNQGGGTTVGTFADLPDGATLRSTGGIAYQIRYNVGAGANDVTLTAVDAPTVLSSTSPAHTGSIRPVLGIVGHDPRGGASDADLTYTWTVASKPAGARSPKFRDNATSSAGHTAPRFFATGDYAFDCTITNTAGVTTTQRLTTTIKRKARALRLTPHAARVRVGEWLQYGGYAIDQFGGHLKTRTITYDLLEGNGVVDATGRFTPYAKGHVRMRITINGLAGVCGATIRA